MADYPAALVEQILDLDIPVTRLKAVVQTDGVLDDGHRESAAAGSRVSHSRSAYANPIEATQAGKHTAGAA